MVWEETGGADREARVRRVAISSSAQDILRAHLVLRHAQLVLWCVAVPFALSFSSH